MTQYRDVKHTYKNESVPIKGVCFQEEEIEEDDCVEAQIDDSMEHHKKIASNQHLLGRDLSGNGSLHPIIEESGSQEGVELDFDQGLIDAYSDLIAQINPDDFLDLDGEYTGKEEISLVGSEVEEGEILEWPEIFFAVWILLRSSSFR